MVNLELYKIFVIVANEKNITKASEILHISQPAVTKHIKNLEEIIDKKLFIRNNKGLELTETGADLYDKLKDPINNILNIDRNIYGTKSIRIGSHNHMQNVMFGKCINKFCLEYPEINLIVKNLYTDDMLQKLKNNELDIVFSKKVSNNDKSEIRFTKLGYLHDIFLVSNNSDLANKVISKEELSRQLIYTPRDYAQTVERFKRIMCEYKVNIKNSSYDTILDVVSKSDAVGLITKEYEEEKLNKYNLVQLETEFDLEPVEFGIYTNKINTMELKNFIKLIKNFYNVI